MIKIGNQEPALLLDVHELVQHYQQDAMVGLAGERLSEAGTGAIFLQGLEGSGDAVVAAALLGLRGGHHVFVLADREDAAYFHNDLQSLLPAAEVLFFPTSYKKAYQLSEIENANVLQRAETLNQVNQNRKSQVILVTYPEAITEKVINQRSLVEHTFSARTGEKVNLDFVVEILAQYEFERTDFVYEAGQYAVRGGILDVFSYANEYPFRIELFGTEIESIRTFDPLTQLSIEPKDFITIIPNVQNKLFHETRDSLWKFLPEDACVWFKDYTLTRQTIAEYFAKAREEHDQLVARSGGTKVISDPDALFDTADDFVEAMRHRTKVEFGHRSHLRGGQTIRFDQQSQPSFGKDFDKLAELLRENQAIGRRSILTSDSIKQLDRLRAILHEIAADVQADELNASLRGGFIDPERAVCCLTDHQIFERFHRYRLKKKFSKSKAITLKELRELHVGDYVTHIDYGVARFGGMEKVVQNGRHQEAIRLIFRDDDLLYIPVHSLHKIAKYSGKEGSVPSMSKLGSNEWQQKKNKAKKQAKDIARDLIALYAKRKAAPGFAYSADTYLQVELETSFLYEDTPDQAKATEAVKADMEQKHPMDRLVCGDVGFGKTEVAIRAAFKAACDGKQVAVLVPTTILAAQHYRTFKERLAKLPCRVDYINRFRSPKEIKDVLKSLSEGKVDILIGTHRITSKDIKFKDLGLLIIDEEQKFGVKTKEKIREMKINVDTLTLTATPIPRTLQFSLMGARDLSVIATPPANRQPVTTEIHSFGDEVIRDAVSHELRRGGQVFFVHNRISDIESIASKIIQLVPDAKVAYAHGQMEGERLEKIMMKFVEGEYDVLVSTNIIESGLDIPNANTIIINRAHQFGLSDLHQMRGRVGRSNRKAYCYLLTPPPSLLPVDSRKRLSALEEFSDLGDGFKIAMRDLDIRGAGDLLNAEQSGFINDLGFEAYNQILEEAIQELKETEFRELFAQELDAQKVLRVDCALETDFEILIPENYVSNISERLNLYIAADQVKTEEELLRFGRSLTDRFGPMPKAVQDLLETVRLRWAAQALGIEKLVLKNDTLKAQLVDSDQHSAYYQSDVFGRLLKFVQRNGKARLKEHQKRALIQVEQVRSIEQAIQLLREI